MPRSAARGDTALAAAVISGRPASDGFADYIEPLADGARAIKGVRQVLHGPGTPAGYCLRARTSSGASGCSASSA